jgi:hypothetical protein
MFTLPNNLTYFSSCAAEPSTDAGSAQLRRCAGHAARSRGAASVRPPAAPTLPGGQLRSAFRRPCCPSALFHAARFSGTALRLAAVACRAGSRVRRARERRSTARDAL